VQKEAALAIELTENDDIYGSVASAVIRNDELRALAGNDEIVRLDADYATVRLGEGNDKVEITRSTSSFYFGDDGADLFSGANLLSNIIDAGAGNDIVQLEQVDSLQVFAGSGADQIWLSFGLAAEVHGGDDADKIYTMGLGGTFWGDAGDDILDAGQAWRVTLDGGEGNDKLYLGVGQADDGMLKNTLIMKGGAGDDFYEIHDVRAKIVELDGQGIDTLSTYVNFTLTSGQSIERIEVAGSNINVRGNEMNNVFVVGGNNDAIDGGAGFDTLFVDVPFDELKADVAEGRIRVMGNDGSKPVMLSSIELLASDGGQFMSMEQLLARSGIVAGTASANRALTGTVNADNIYGFSGNDVLYGLTGADDLYGGCGADVFDFNSVKDSALGNRDCVMDFSASNDKIDLSGIDASSRAGGNNAFKFIGLQAFQKQAGELKMWHRNNVGTSNDYTVVAGDVNGDGRADFAINVKGLIAFSADNFML
jgi:Ca2+-binding RTX toxin-like protein